MGSSAWFCAAGDCRPATVEGRPHIPEFAANGSSRFIAEVGGRIRSLIPREIVGGPEVQIAMRVHTRLLSRYEGIGMLLGVDLADDAYALVRGLMADSQKLQVLASNPDMALGRAFGWMAVATADLEARARVARRFGDDDLARLIDDSAATQRLINERLAVDLGISPARFPREGEPLASLAGHPEDVFDHTFASDSAHSVLVAAVWHDHADAAGNVRIGANLAPWTLRVATRATRHMLRASTATAQICQFDSAAALQDYVDEVEGQLDARSLPVAD